MNMLDTKKSFRGVLLWREDILKCAKCERRPLSEVVRDLLHAAMSKHTLTGEDSRVLQAQIAKAVEVRNTKFPPKGSGGRRGGSGSRTLTVDRMTIPTSVRKNPKFVKTGKGK